LASSKNPKTISDKVSDLKDDAKDKFREIKRDVKDYAHDAKVAAEDYMTAAGEKLEDLKDRAEAKLGIKRKPETFVEKVKEEVADAVDYVADVAEEVRNKIKGIIQ